MSEVSIDVSFMMAARFWASENRFELVDRTQQMPVAIQLRGATAPLTLDFYVDGVFRLTQEISHRGVQMPLTCAPRWIMKGIPDDRMPPQGILFDDGVERVLGIAPHGQPIALEVKLRYASEADHVPYAQFMHMERMD